ncbi:MAG: alpha/beta hydrolase [Spirochaetes bacterium]|nr:alpha/beta hydrolase [Spirochaetota bacterium]
MPFAAVRDIRIYYEIRGTGRRLLYIGGTGGDLRHRPSIFDSPLADRFEILAYDQRGLGQTDRPDNPCTMADYAMDADGLLEAVGWDRCCVMGVSFGGMVAQECALRFPGRVERLVLACTSSGGAGGASYPLHELEGLPARERALKVILLSDTRRDTAWQADHARHLTDLVDREAATLKVGADEPGRETGVRRQIEARRGHNTYDRLPALRMPVFICGGRYDGIAPAFNLEAMHRQIPQSLLELFEGGHLFLLQDPKAFERVGAFLEGTLEG